MRIFCANKARAHRGSVWLGEFGERTFLLDALPAVRQGRDARRFVLDPRDGEGGGPPPVEISARLGEHTIRQDRSAATR